MNCLNGGRFVRAALDSVYGQTVQDWEIIFLDNASTDDTAEIARGYDARLRYIANRQTVPLGQARNQALRAARGEFVAFLDVDDAWLPHKLERQLPVFDDPGVDFVFADTELHFADTGVRRSYFQFHRHRPPRGVIIGDLLKHYSIPMLTAVIRARTLQALPQWFDDEFTVCDDFDFFMRLAQRSRCDYVDDVLATCLIHDEAVTVKWRRNAPREMRCTLTKLEQADPAFRTTYSREVAAFLRRVDYQEAKASWAEGDRRQARALFLRHWRHPRFVLSYAAAWLPYAGVARLRYLAR
jgi:glycosyltransferase involved in cell wall biosynthesis